MGDLEAGLLNLIIITATALVGVVVLLMAAWRRQ